MVLLTSVTPIKSITNREGKQERKSRELERKNKKDMRRKKDEALNKIITKHKKTNRNNIMSTDQ